MMKVGMLWLDDDRLRPLITKVELAANHFEQKHGRAPNVCYVHPSMLPSDEVLATPITVVGSEAILPYHLWLGVRDEPKREMPSHRSEQS